LFTEWNAELKEYSSSTLRKKSQEQLTQTRAQYGQLIKAMKRAEAKMDPVLAKFKDQVLFLKHNLNAQAIASLKGELVSVEGNINSLIKDLNASIQEADSFIAAMPKTKPRGHLSPRAATSFLTPFFGIASASGRGASISKWRRSPRLAFIMCKVVNP